MYDNNLLHKTIYVYNSYIVIFLYKKLWRKSQ